MSIQRFQTCGKRKTRRAGAMSLIEILVAVCVISVLASLLYPALRAAIRRSGDGKCVGNLRAFGTTANIFFAENGFILPNYEYTNGVSIEGTSWIERLEAIDKVSVSQSVCPAAEVKFRVGSDGLSYHRKSARNDGFVNYGWNAGIPQPDRGEPLLQVGNAAGLSRCMLMADGAATETLSQGVLPGSWLIQGPNSEANRSNPNRKNNFGFRHGGRANILFVDGHVESRSQKEVPLTRPQTEESLIFYSGK